MGILIHSCASFDKNLTNPNPLNRQNLTDLNGTYGIVQLKFDSISKNYKKQIWTYNNFFKEIDRKLIKDTLKLDSLNKYYFNLKVISPRKIKFEYIENGNIFKERTLKTRLKKDGYLYLKNKNTKFLLVPYIAGALDVKKTRFSKSENGNLIFDVSKHRSGAVLIVVFLDGRTWRYRHEYKRVE